MIYIRKLTE